MYLPFPYEHDTSNTSLTFCTKVTDMSAEDEKHSNAMTTLFKKIQSKAREVACTNSNDWFNKMDAAFDDAADSFAEPLKEHAENKYPPHLKVKYYRDSENGLPQFPIYDGATMTALHTRQNPCLNFSCADTFAMSTRHILILDCSGIWSLNRRGGITWRINDALSFAPVVSFPFKNVSTIQKGSHVDDEYKPPEIDMDDEFETSFK